MNEWVHLKIVQGTDQSYKLKAQIGKTKHNHTNEKRLHL